MRKFTVTLGAVVFLLFGGSGLTQTRAQNQAPTSWVLKSSKITYTVDHPMHETVGVSAGARGKGQCEKARCEFLVASPVKAFDSGNSNRDAHVMEVVHGEKFPMVSVRVVVDEGKLNSGPVDVDVDVELAGVKVAKKMKAHVEGAAGGSTLSVRGEIPVMFSDFKLERPSLLGVAVKDAMPVVFESQWDR
jgi:hypothetical protein